MNYPHKFEFTTNLTFNSIFYLFLRFLERITPPPNDFSLFICFQLMYHDF